MVITNHLVKPPPTLRPFAPPKPAKRTVTLKEDTSIEERRDQYPVKKEKSAEGLKSAVKRVEPGKPHDLTNQLHRNRGGKQEPEPRLSDRNLQLNPRDEEFAELHRQTVRDQIVRAGRFNQWNLADISPDQEFEGISPHRRIQTLKNLPPTMVQIRRQNYQPGKGHNDPPRGIPWQSDRPISPVEKSAGSNRVRNLWERRIEEHEDWKNRSYYPVGPVRRWDSVDALSASLIATRNDRQHFPPLNPRPIQRHLSTHGISHSLDRNKYHPPPRDPLFNQPVDYLQEQLRRGQSLDNLILNNMMVQNHNNWYDASQIKEAISHESIGNLGNTKSKWEQRIDDNRPLHYGNGNSHHQHQQIPSLTTNGSSSGHLLYSSMGNQPGNEEPPPTMGLGRGLNLIEKEIQHYREREAELKHRSASMPPHRQQDHMDHRGEQDRQKELMLYYLKTRPDVLPALGIQIPNHIRQTLETLGHAVPKVELVECGGQSNGMTYQNGGSHQSYANGHTAVPPSLNGSAQSTLERQNRSQGRYVKNTQPSGRKLSNGRMPSTPSGGTRNGMLSPGESLIAREIREAKEREEELSLSRSQLGLPSLTDILEEWKESGGRIRSARSYDHLHWQEVMDARPVRDAIKAGSLDRLHRVEFPHEREREPSPPRRENRGRIQEEIEFNLKREESLRRNRGPQNINGAPQEGSSPPLSNPYGGVNMSQRSQYGPNGQLQRRYNFVEIQPDQDFAPVSALTTRSSKNQRNNGLVGLNHPTDSEISESSSNVSAGDNQQLGVRTREYVGQRNPGFKPGHSGEVYGLQQRDDPDEMILAPAGRRKMPQPTWLR